jgi:hypothetical protein
MKIKRQKNDKQSTQNSLLQITCRAKDTHFFDNAIFNYFLFQLFWKYGEMVYICGVDMA